VASCHSNLTASESKNLTNHKGRYFTAMLSKIFIAATLATTAMAYCPNGCSGHGTCQTNPKVSLPLLHPTNPPPPNASIVSQKGIHGSKENDQTARNVPPMFAQPLPRTQGDAPHPLARRALASNTSCASWPPHFHGIFLFRRK
jgi:hypothetical protein